MNKVYIGSRSITANGHYALKRLEKYGLELIFGPPGQRPTEEDLLRDLPECVAYLAGTEVINKKVLTATKNLKVISRNGVGIENIDLEAAEELGIKVETTPGSNAQGVAELAITLLLTSLRSVPSCSSDLKKGEWKRIKGIEIDRRTLGIIGLGNIGKSVASMALGLRMKVLGYDPFTFGNFNPSNDFEYTSFDELLSNSHFISLHLPPAKKPIIDSKAISKMKKGVYIINTARAGVVDEDAILDGLNEEKIAMYATDVYKTEPPEINDLILHPRTICTPHIGAFTTESIDRAMSRAVDKILEVLGFIYDD